MERLEAILGNLGLGEAEIAAFACLAGKKKATMEELYEGSSLSRKAISLALDGLEAAGAVKRDGPDFIIEDVREALLALLPARYEELKAEIYSYRPAPVRVECPVVEVINEGASAERNIDAALTGIDVISRSLAWLDEVSLNAARAAVQRGVRMRVITRKRPGLEADARALSDAGIEVREHEYARDTQFMVVDAGLIAFALKEPPREAGQNYFCLLIRDKNACKKILESIFEPAWNESEVVEEYRI